MEDIGDAFKKMAKGKVRYRYVIDISTLRAQETATPRNRL